MTFNISSTLCIDGVWIWNTQYMAVKHVSASKGRKMFLEKKVPLPQSIIPQSTT